MTSPGHAGLTLGISNIHRIVTALPWTITPSRSNIFLAIGSIMQVLSYSLVGQLHVSILYR